MNSNPEKYRVFSLSIEWWARDKHLENDKHTNNVTVVNRIKKLKWCNYWTIGGGWWWWWWPAFRKVNSSIFIYVDEEEFIKDEKTTQSIHCQSENNFC